MRSLWFGVLVCAAMFVACSDDDSDFATRPSGGSSYSAKSSSSSAESSSSVTLATPCKTDSTNTCEYGELVDDRDGQTYKTVKIGDQWWMAENLNYAYLQPTKDLDSSSFCYNDSAEYCEKYGRLYLWSAAAMDSAGTWSTNGKGCGYGKTCSPTYPLRGVCPKGWHLPSKTEWETLIIAVGGSSEAGDVLKSRSGWNNFGPGSAAFGFSAPPAGLRSSNGNYYYDGDNATFWSSTEYDSYEAFRVSMSRNLPYVGVYGGTKGDVFSVRCVKD